MENLENLQKLAEALPESVRTNATNLITEMGTPVEGIGDEPVAWKPGYLRLVQGTTDRGSIPKGATIGDFVLGEEKVEQPLRFIPIRMWKGRQYWDPDQTSNKILCYSPDGTLGSVYGECKTCEHGKWNDEEGKPSDCSLNRTTMVIKSDLSSIFTVTFGKSNYKIGGELENLMKKAGVATYARVYGLTNATSPTAKNVENFKIEVLDAKDRKTNEAHLPFLKELFDRVSADRKASLDAFYEGAKYRQEQLKLSGNAPLAIEASSTVVTETTSVEIPVKPGKATESNLAMKYQV